MAGVQRYINDGDGHGHGGELTHSSDGDGLNHGEYVLWRLWGR